MKIAVTGGTGLVGRVLVDGLGAAGHAVTVLGRRAPAQGAFRAPVAFAAYDLTGAAPDLRGTEAVVHAAFSHLPGRYRGGEGNDPAGFLAANRDGSLRLLDEAERAAVGQVVFLSSRAVYGSHPAGRVLRETTACRPDTLYGEMKLQVEAALEGRGFAASALRATGVYGPPGPGQRHKWAQLFADFEAGREIAPRVGTEVHGDDLAAALLLVLGRGVTGPVNVSDIVLDRRDLLAEYGRLAGIDRPLPARADSGALTPMATERLGALGWRPGGMARLCPTLEAILENRD